MIDENDKILFRDTVDNKAVFDKDKTQPSNTLEQGIFSSYSLITDANLTASDFVNYAQSGTSTKLIKKMKRGDVGKVPTLDLHGQTVIEACKSLARFIHFHQQEKFIHIIHGKGYNSNNHSILKSQTVSFLKQHPQVMAFNSCPPKDGGTGAVFILLKRG